MVLGNVWDEPAAAVTPMPTDQVVFGFPGAGGGYGQDGVLRGAVMRSVTLAASTSPSDRRGLEARAAFRQAGFAVRDERDMPGIPAASRSIAVIVEALGAVAAGSGERGADPLPTCPGTLLRSGPLSPYGRNGPGSPTSMSRCSRSRC
ncbi:hypothetical protein DEJ31_14150 [Curtobacterium sp. MCPF17_031]|nr:hypothetical protein DEJ31_14150 [Curtobacterium sp. MCPF17_031]